MKLLLDSCVWGGATEPLREKGHDVFWCGDIFPDPGDELILRRAVQEQRILVTQAEAIDFIVSKHGDLLVEGAIITLKSSRLRIRKPLPGK